MVNIFEVILKFLKYVLTVNVYLFIFAFHW